MIYFFSELYKYLLVSGKKVILRLTAVICGYIKQGSGRQDCLSREKKGYSNINLYIGVFYQ